MSEFIVFASHRSTGARPVVAEEVMTGGGLGLMFANHRPTGARPVVAEKRP